MFSVLCQNGEHSRSGTRRFLKRVVKFMLSSSYPRKRSCHRLLFLFSECNVACQFTRPNHKWFNSTGSESILKGKWHERRRHVGLDDRGSCPVVWSWVSSFFLCHFFQNRPILARPSSKNFKKFCKGDFARDGRPYGMEMKVTEKNVSFRDAPVLPTFTTTVVCRCARQWISRGSSHVRALSSLFSSLRDVYLVS